MFKQAYFFVLLLIFIPFLFGDSDVDAKLRQIQSVASRSSSNVILLDDSSYPHYVGKTPRPYHLIVFFTTNHHKFKCDTCK